MKKILLSMMALVGALSLTAATVTFTAGVDLGSITDYNNHGADQLTKDGVTLAITDGCLGLSTDYRIYKSQTLTVTSEIGNITGVKFTCTANGTAKQGPGCFTVTDGEYTFETDGPTGTWTGDAAEVVFTAATNQVRATEIVVTIGGEAPTVAAPTFNPRPGTFYEPVEVTLIAGKDCEIYYATAVVGASGATDFFLYEEPFTLEVSTSVMAYAVDVTGAQSEIVSATYTIEEEPSTPEVATIAEFLEKKPTEATTITGDVVVTYDGNSNGGGYNALFLQDDTGVLLAYYAKAERSEYEQGTVLAGITGVYGEYGGEPQMTSPVEGEIKGQEAVLPTLRTIAEINEAASINEYVLIKDANVNVADKKASDATGELAIYTRFQNVPLPETDLEGVEILALTARFKGTQQIYPIEFKESEPPTPTVAAPTFEPEPGTYTEPVTVTLTAEEGCEIYYATAVNDGELGATNFNLYEKPFTLEVSTTVSAYAMDVTGAQSDIVTGKYVIETGGDENVVEIDCTTAEWTFTADGLKVTQDGVTIDLSQAEGSNSPTQNPTAKDIRAYANNTIVVKADRDIKKATFTLSAMGVKRYSNENTVDAGELTRVGEDQVEWGTEAREFTITVGEKATGGTDGETKAGQFDFVKVRLELTGEIIPPVEELDAPKMTPAGGTYYGPVRVSIAADEGADIYYTIAVPDAVVADEAFALYEGPFTLEETSDVFAYAVKGELRSETTVESYVIEEEPVEPTVTIEEFLSAQPTSSVPLGEVTVVYDGLTDEGGYNALFVKDETGSLLLYFNKQEREIYEQGDVLDRVSGTYSTYGDEPQMNADAASLSEPVGHVAVEPVTKTLAEINEEASTNELVVVENVDVDVENRKIYQGEDQVTIYTRFKNVELPEADLTGTNVLGLTARFKTTQQIYPLDFNYKSSGIDNINAKAAAKGIYNLQGMKVNEMIPGQLYIVDGKKVIATR